MPGCPSMALSLLGLSRRASARYWCRSTSHTTGVDRSPERLVGVACAPNETGGCPRHLPKRRGRRPFDGQLEARGDAHAAQQAQLALAEAHRRFADRPQNARVQIVLAADVI